MVNIDMFRHPKYYKELRKRNKEIGKAQPCVREAAPISNSDQVISPRVATASARRAPDSGLQQVIEETVPHKDIEEASSNKLQAPSSSNLKRQASSPKHKGSSAKPQAASSWTRDPGKSFKHL